MIQEGNFRPPWYLANPHLQTILANIIKPTFPEVSYETVALADGDSLQLARGTARGGDTILVLHGLEGSLRSAYAQRLLNALNQAALPAAFMFFRGCDGRPNNQLRSYHSGETDDLRQVIQHLKQTGSERIILVGYSLGGNVTLKYLGEGETDEAIIAAVAISVPLLLDICAERMDRGFSRVYQHSLLRRLKNKVRQKEQLLVAHGFSTELDSIKNFVQFDDRFTAPVHGFDDAMHYYRSCSSRQFLQHIQTPTLVIQARDDPFMTSAVLPGELEISAAVTVELSAHGGHVGFISGGSMKPHYWLEPRIMEFIHQQLS